MPRKSKDKIDNEELLQDKLNNAKSSKVKSKKASSEKSELISDTDKKATTAKKTTKTKTNTKSEKNKGTKAKSVEPKTTKTSTTTKSESTKVKSSKPKAKAKSAKTKTKSAKTTSVAKMQTEVAHAMPEYYDLPYRYNKTVIKLLAQNPNTLFVYWEISDEDRNKFIEQYGENFFYITKPVLVIHNLTDNYSYEIDINDFANNWYINVNNVKCEYVVELGRRLIEHTDKIQDDYLYVTSSNTIQSPNDHVLFFKNNDEIYFKNIHTNKYTKRVIKPFLKNVVGIYDNLNITSEVNSFDFNNPSSNPTSNVM